MQSWSTVHKVWRCEELKMIQCQKADVEGLKEWNMVMQ